MMGKAEHLKLERKLLKEQQRAMVGNKHYRNRIFLYGFIAGAVASAVVFGGVSSMKKDSSATVPKSFASDSATQNLGSPLALPSDIKLTAPTASPGGL